jgi:RNA polymerase sigma factor (TIGR02999 family)
MAIPSKRKKEGTHGTHPPKRVSFHPPMADVTQLLTAIEHGDRKAAAQLLPLVYQELRGLARQQLAREGPGHTLQATALVHEAYLRLVGLGDEAKWDGRAHFFAAAAEAMRRILVDAYRRKQADKRGGGMERSDIEIDHIALPAPNEDLIALDEALNRLAEQDSVKAELVKLRYFVGMTLPEAAKVLQISTTTADRYWAYSKAWLLRDMTGAGPGTNGQ